jgi:hypothetical protein
MSEILILSGSTDTDLKKKGRKPKQANYFDVREEMAVVRFLSTESSEEKNKIYVVPINKKSKRIDKFFFYCA